MKRKSQIQTYLEHNEGPGVQHLDLVSEDIFRTLREMRKRSGVDGFEFMPSLPPTYYRNLKGRAGDVLSDEQIEECEKLGILVDRDDQGTLLQIFTKTVGDSYRSMRNKDIIVGVLWECYCVQANDIHRDNPKNRVHAERRIRKGLPERRLWRIWKG